MGKNDREFSEKEYEGLVQSIFQRFPSVQNSTFKEAYKPGLQHMHDFNALLHHPDMEFRSVHIAGTNGKGSVANMIASVLAASGLKVGLYTSPHILDFRERMRIADGRGTAYLVSKEYVYNFLTKWSRTFDELQLSFFEITTAMAFRWFADEHTDVAVIEVGLGGRLDSTNVITPDLAVVTSIGLDHCDLLGDTLAKIAYEKAGIFKPGVSAVIGETNPETEPVFRRHFEEVNHDRFMEVPDSKRSRMPDDQERLQVGGNAPSLFFADQTEPSLWNKISSNVLDQMDLKGEYQEGNLRTTLLSLDVLSHKWLNESDSTGADERNKAHFNGIAPESRRDNKLFRSSALLMEKPDVVETALIHTASRMGFHGRWEMICSKPAVICDIGHNAPALIHNFAQLNEYLDTGKYSSLIIVYGVMADKDLSAILPLFPERATWIFTTPDTKRAKPAAEICSEYEAYCRRTKRVHGEVFVSDRVTDAVEKALELARKDGSVPLIYVGGSTFVVAEAAPLFQKPQASF